MPALRGPIITEVTLVDQVRRDQAGVFSSSSLPGHLIHICTSGEVEQSANGVKQRIGPSRAIWYHENESVKGKVLNPPWEFFTVNFQAPSIPPPPLTHRISVVERSTVDRMGRLLKLWREKDRDGILCHLQIHSILLSVIADLFHGNSTCRRIDGSTQVWWEIESLLRDKLEQPIDVTMLKKISGKSQRTIDRACRLATGLSPMKRIKKVRLSYARGLVQFSDLSMTAIAMKLGYPRVQEFSRDYRSIFGCTPTQDRKNGPDYLA